MIDSRNFLLPLLVLLLSFQLPGEVAAQQGKSPTPSPSAQQEKTNKRTERLIEQLGSDEFSVRQAAKAELERMGLEAFDALFDAQDHADIEVALVARYLIRSMNVHWARDDDPEVVRRILNDYRSQPSEKRRDLMLKLASLKEGMGIGPLCRIIRYESDGSLAKSASLLLLEIVRPGEEQVARRWASSIRETIGNSQRSASQWALAYADTLTDPAASLPTWDRLIRAEYQTLVSYPEKSDREIVRKLKRWHAELLLDLEKRDEALVVMRETIKLLERDRRQLIDWLDWLLLHDAPELVTEVAEQFAEVFSQDPELIYRVAETQLLQGNTQQANATAARAREIQKDNAIVHYTLASNLKERELFEWAEAEYRVVIENTPDASLQSISARRLLAEMLHDIQRDKDAGDVLQELVEVAQENDAARKALGNLQLTIEEVQARMNFFYSADLATNANVEEAKQRLLKGFEADPNDVDLLIAMYRLKSDDPDWKKKVEQALKSGIAHHKNEINKYKQQAGGNGRNPLQRNSVYYWAMACNQYAWLVSNTEGDYQDAIKQSHQSLKLVPDSASYLDTLGRCYYAAGDLENAIKYQREAVQLEPHMGQIKRQLELFEKELKQQEEQESGEGGGS